MPKKPDVVLEYDVNCQFCRAVTGIILDPQKVVADYVLKYIDQRLGEILIAHQKDLAAAIKNRGKSAGDEDVRRLESELGQMSKERDALREQAAGLAARLEEKISDQTSTRTDVGTSTHTIHRQLADRVSALSPRIHRISRRWGGANSDVHSSRQSWSKGAALIFRLLFAPSLAPEADGQRWSEFVGADEEARSLADDASVLARDIMGSPGYQKWIWDLVPCGTRFDPDFHEPWQSCAEEGPIEFVVIPAYLVDFAVITKPKVFTSWPDPSSESS